MSFFEILFTRVWYLEKPIMDQQPGWGVVLLISLNSCVWW